MSRSLLATTIATAMLAATNCVNAQVVVASLDSSNLPIYQPNGFAGFSFGDFPPPAIISQPPVLAFDITDIDSGNGVFGGIGVDVLLSIGEDADENQIPLNFPSDIAFWELRLRIGPNNEATSIRTTLIDIDGPEQESGGGEGGALFMTGDEHVYEYDLTQVPDDGNFHTLTIPLNSPLFTQTAFGLSPGNGVVDPGLKQLQIQSVFGSSGRLNVDIEYARIVVPEPATCLLLGLGGVALLGRRV